MSVSWKILDCAICSEEYYDKVEYIDDVPYCADLCIDCARDVYFQRKWGLDGVNEIFREWSKNEEWLDDIDLYFYSERFNFELEIPKNFSLAFYKFKALICMALSLHNKKSTLASGIYLDFYGQMSHSECGSEWNESGYELGRGLFRNWWIVEI